MQQLAKYLAATGRRLRILGNVICHFFRKGKLGLKIAIKIPFFVDIEFSFETDWNMRFVCGAASTAPFQSEACQI